MNGSNLLGQVRSAWNLSNASSVLADVSSWQRPWPRPFNCLNVYEFIWLRYVTFTKVYNLFVLQLIHKNNNDQMSRLVNGNLGIQRFLFLPLNLRLLSLPSSLPPYLPPSPWPSHSRSPPWHSWVHVLPAFQFFWLEDNLFGRWITPRIYG